MRQGGRQRRCPNDTKWAAHHWLAQRGGRYGSTKTSCYPDLKLVWLEIGVVSRLSVQGILLSVVHRSHPSVSVCTFSLLLCGFCLQTHPLELLLGDCSAGVGCFHINRLGVAREISHNKHFGGKNSGKWQVSKSLPLFPSTCVRRTLLRQLQNGAHTPSLSVAGNWVIWSHMDFPSLTKKYGPKFAHRRQRKQASRCTHRL